ncbi:hypothetical protein BGZ83_010646 [Gryganskiella cystojenkinii]|nr:hypothetical protein BGZ83_010646 [Gryganskiella cystojenkinii]
MSNTTSDANVSDALFLDLSSYAESLKRHKKAARLAAIPDEDKGILYWEDWCYDEKCDLMPTWDKLAKFIKEMVIPMEKALIQRVLEDPTKAHYSGAQVFLEPVLRLRERMLQELDSANPSVDPALNDNNPSDDPALNDITAENTVVESTLSRSITSLSISSPVPSSSSSSLNLPAASAGMSKAPPSQVGTPKLLTTRPVIEPASRLRPDTPTPVQSFHPEPSNNGAGSEPTPRRLNTHHAFTSAATTRVGTTTRTTTTTTTPRFDAQDFKFVWRGQRAVRIEDASTEIPKHQLSDRVKTVVDVLQEWLYGIDGGPALQELNRAYIGGWRIHSETRRYCDRVRIVQTYVRLIREQGHSQESAIRLLNKMQGTLGLSALRSKIDEGAKDEDYNDDNDELEDDIMVTVPAKRQRRGRLSQLTLERSTLVEGTGLTQVEKDNFPFPIRDLQSINDVWKEWTVGWKDGEPSIESLIEIHDKVWQQGNYRKHFYFSFYYKNRITNAIGDSVKDGAVKSEQEAIRILEKARNHRPLSTFCGSKDFRDILAAWGLKKY